jgi:hypothetical protein
MSMYLVDPRRISDPSFPSGFKIPSAQDLEAILGNIAPEKTGEEFREALKKEYVNFFKEENGKLGKASSSEKQ